MKMDDAKGAKQSVVSPAQQPPAKKTLKMDDMKM
jgi:hypothetical protein